MPHKLRSTNKIDNNWLFLIGDGKNTRTERVHYATKC